MTDSRPNPDALLARVAAEETRSRRGLLKIFFGASAGVGKTYAMLEEARKRAQEGMDVLVGYAEPHIRPETEGLLLGMEIQPYKLVAYKGATFKEFDLDAVLQRKPALVCVDELAHTNMPGEPLPRHAKRFQDVLELLDAGIHVYTTLNVQHLESVNDIVERTSGAKVRETLPDWVFEQADDVQLIDIPPDKLIERIKEGRIYKQHDAEHITKQFFNKGNLSALRELALRRTADRVDAQMEAFRRESGVTESWPAADRIMVCVGPSPFGARLVRSARRMAQALKTQWIAAHVETPRSAGMPAEARERVMQTLRLAEQLGGQTVTLSGAKPVEEILAYARTRNVARVIIGKPERPRWREWLTGSIVDDLIRKSGPIDIYVIRDQGAGGPPPRREAGVKPKPFEWQPYAWASLLVLATSAVGWVLYHPVGHERHFSNTNCLMINLLGVLFVAQRFGRGPSLWASMLSVVAFDFTVVPPYYSFDVSDTQYFVTFAVMFVTALFISTLTDRVRSQGETARLRERRTAALLDLSRELAGTRETARIVATSARHVSEVFGAPAAVLLPDQNKHLVSSLGPDTIGTPAATEKEASVAQWTYEHGEAAGATTQTLPSSTGLYLPMRGSRGVIGVLAIYPDDPAGLADPDRLRLLEAFAGQAAVAVERAALAEEAQRAWERAETELIRNTLLSGVSHDLRTPLAAITGSATTLLEAWDMLAPDGRTELLASIADESEHMERLINNLLDMTRLESGSIQPRRELFPLQELVVSSLERLKKRLAGRAVEVNVPADLPLLSVDGLLFEQSLINLLENAIDYTPAGTPIEISAAATDADIKITIADHGPGLPPEDPGRVFQKFYRSAAESNRRGIGLGLAIVKGVVELHGGTITAANAAGGGARFVITLKNASGRRSFKAAEEPGVGSAAGGSAR